MYIRCRVLFPDTVSGVFRAHYGQDGHHPPHACSADRRCSEHSLKRWALLHFAQQKINQKSVPNIFDKFLDHERVFFPRIYF